MKRLIIYDDCQNDVWHPKIGDDINQVHADVYKAYNTQSGLLVMNDSSLEMGGGLVGADYPLPENCKFFGLDVRFMILDADLRHLGRQELDLKITLFSGATKPLPNQANGSAQWKDGAWQLDPDGKSWVDTGYAPGPFTPNVPNDMQFRYWSDGVKWTVLGLLQNDDANGPFIPDHRFQNLPLITTNWSAGLHPQLQMEVTSAPYFLRQTYTRIRILASDSPIPWNLA